MTLEYVKASKKDLFERGKLYVALSRANSFEGITVTGLLREQLPVDAEVLKFHRYQVRMY